MSWLLNRRMSKKPSRYSTVQFWAAIIDIFIEFCGDFSYVHD